MAFYCLLVHISTTGSSETLLRRALFFLGRQKSIIVVVDPMVMIRYLPGSHRTQPAAGDEHEQPCHSSTPLCLYSQHQTISKCYPDGHRQEISGRRCGPKAQIFDLQRHISGTFLTLPSRTSAHRALTIPGPVVWWVSTIHILTTSVDSP